MTPESTGSPEPFDDFKDRVQQKVNRFCTRKNKSYLKAKDINEDLGETRKYTGRALTVLCREWDAIDHYAGRENASTYVVDHSELEDE